MEKDNVVKTTWRIPANLYEELQAISEREKISINTAGIDRLRAASIGGRFDKLDKEIAALKKMIRELLEKT